MKFGIALLCACLLLLCAPLAHASGDPAVVYILGGGIVVQLALVIFIVTARVFRRARLPVLTAYALHLLVLWPWVWESKPSERLPGIALILMPCLIVGALLWMLVTARAPSNSSVGEDGTADNRR